MEHLDFVSMYSYTYNVKLSIFQVVCKDKPPLLQFTVGYY